MPYHDNFLECLPHASLLSVESHSEQVPSTGSHLSGPDTLFSDRLTLLRQPLSRLRAEVTASESPVGLLKGEKRQLREVDAGAVMLCVGPP